ncbi:MAG: glycosyltransferase family 2 protein [Rhodospirillaceae bacterium]|jgi:dolichol-phosphate mannosyltransferase|nr:glycosyltransferase family 2 protein [Rhodospirillaceae bacterium]MBT6137647.1 glycosyltransferase family 2 protein [Rhodospirillaceae bacterium]
MPILVQSLAEWEAAGIENLLSVIIPAHNEEGQLEETVRALVDALSSAEISHEILVINDNSTDKTEDILARLTEEISGLSYMNNDPPNGFGFAIRAGLSAFKGDCVALVMADGSDDPNDLVAFFRKRQEGYDCVFGTRFSRQSKVVDYPLPKLLLNRLGNLLIRTLFWMGYNDTTNAFKLYGRNVIAGLQPLLAYDFNLTVELPLKAIARGYSYAVVPNSWRNRKEGVSKFKVDELAARYLFIIFYCWLEKRLSRHDYADRSDLKETQLQVWHR